MKLFYEKKIDFSDTKYTTTIKKIMIVTPANKLQTFQERILRIQKASADYKGEGWMPFIKVASTIAALSEAYEVHGNFCLRKRNDHEYDCYLGRKLLSFIEIGMDDFPSSENLESLIVSLEWEFGIRN